VRSSLGYHDVPDVPGSEGHMAVTPTDYLNERILDRPVDDAAVMAGGLGDDELMSESRKQRRARERAEAKAASRANLPAPPPARPLPPSRRAAVLEVDLSRYVAPDDPSEVVWAATWGLRDESVSTEDRADDLPELVTSILEDAQPLGDRYDVRIEWILGGDGPEGQTVADAVADAGVALPDRLPQTADSAQTDEFKVNTCPATTATARVSKLSTQSYPVTGTSGPPKSGS
jgi:hypothetical protein